MLGRTEGDLLPGQFRAAQPLRPETSNTRRPQGLFRVISGHTSFRGTMGGSARLHAAGFRRGLTGRTSLLTHCDIGGFFILHHESMPVRHEDPAKRAGTWRYEAFQETLETEELGPYWTYGIRLVGGGEVAAVHGVTVRRDVAEDLAALFTEAGLSPLHLEDALADLTR